MSDPKSATPADWLHAWREAVDPFGMLDACQRVQQAWLQAPGELNEQLATFTRDATTVQLHAA